MMIINEQFVRGVSRCTCGHIGDIATNPAFRGLGDPVQHGGLLGHGPCLVRGCYCEKFTWQERIVEGRPASKRSVR